MRREMSARRQKTQLIVSGPMREVSSGNHLVTSIVRSPQATSAATRKLAVWLATKKGYFLLAATLLSLRIATLPAMSAVMGGMAPAMVPVRAGWLDPLVVRTLWIAML